MATQHQAPDPVLLRSLLDRTASPPQLNPEHTAFSRGKAVANAYDQALSRSYQDMIYAWSHLQRANRSSKPIPDNDLQSIEPRLTPHAIIVWLKTCAEANRQQIRLDLNSWDWLNRDDSHMLAFGTIETWELADVDDPTPPVLIPWSLAAVAREFRRSHRIFALDPDAVNYGSRKIIQCLTMCPMASMDIWNAEAASDYANTLSDSLNPFSSPSATTPYWSEASLSGNGQDESGLTAIDTVSKSIGAYKVNFERPLSGRVTYPERKPPSFMEDMMTLDERLPK